MDTTKLYQVIHLVFTSSVNKYMLKDILNDDYSMNSYYFTEAKFYQNNGLLLHVFLKVRNEFINNLVLDNLQFKKLLELHRKR